MNHRTTMSAMALLGLILGPAAAGAQQRDQLLAQARQVVEELTSLKSNGALGAEQAAEVDELLPLATALSNELEKPQADGASLRELSGDLAEIQKQVSALKRAPR
jgi:uncharacterized coiled-coil DUF342 family protein